MSIKDIFNIIKNARKGKHFVLAVTDSSIDDDISEQIRNTQVICDTDCPDIWYTNLSNVLLTNICNKVGEDKFNNDMKIYNEMLYNLYKECDYQIAKSDYLEAELNYYKLINNAEGGDANKAFMLYKELQKKKEVLDSFN